MLGCLNKKNSIISQSLFLIPDKEQKFHVLTRIQNVIPAYIRDSHITNIIHFVWAGWWINNGSTPDLEQDNILTCGKNIERYFISSLVVTFTLLRFKSLSQLKNLGYEKEIEFLPYFELSYFTTKTQIQCPVRCWFMLLKPRLIKNQFTNVASAPGLSLLNCDSIKTCVLRQDTTNLYIQNHIAFIKFLWFIIEYSLINSLIIVTKEYKRIRNKKALISRV